MQLVNHFEKSGAHLVGMVAKNDIGLYFSVQISKMFRYPNPPLCEMGCGKQQSWGVFPPISPQIHLCVDDTITIINSFFQATGNPQLQSYQITTLPMEQLRLVWANSAQHLSDDFTLNTEWQSYANQDNNLGFEIVVTSNEVCFL